MITKMKALGLALLAAFAISAVAASGASALEAEIPSTEGEVTFTANQAALGEHPAKHTFTNFFGQISCNKAVFEGTVKNGATHLTVTPTYSECTVGANFVTVTHTGCNYNFYGGAATPEEPDHFENVTVDLECPENVTGIDIHVYTDEGHTNQKCEYVVHPFEEKHANTLTNTTNNEVMDVDITTTVTGIATKRTMGGFLSCGPENTNNTYTGATTLQAFSDEEHKEPIDITVK